MGQTIKFERVEQAAQESLAFGTTIPGKSGWVATIDMPDGGRYIADKIDGEAGWTVNGEWAPGCSMPRFWNGQLSRCAIPVKLSPTDNEIVEIGAHLRTHKVLPRASRGAYTFKVNPDVIQAAVDDFLADPDYHAIITWRN